MLVRRRSFRSGENIDDVRALARLDLGLAAAIDIGGCESVAP